MPKHPCFDKRAAEVTVKKPATRPVWLLLGLCRSAAGSYDPQGLWLPVPTTDKQ
jgi:hypothetical protein